MPDKIQNHCWKDFPPQILKIVLKSIFHGLMTEKITFYLRLEKGKIAKSAFLKSIF